MTNKVYKLVTAIIGGVETIAVGVVTFLNPAYATAINSAVIIVGTAALEVCNLFVKDDLTK